MLSLNVDAGRHCLGIPPNFIFWPSLASKYMIISYLSRLKNPENSLDMSGGFF
jgi:hypothetical protein